MLKEKYKFFETEKKNQIIMKISFNIDFGNCWLMRKNVAKKN